MIHKFFTCLVLATLSWGCAPWVMVDGKYSSPSENYEIDLPGGWRRHTFSRDALRMTKDGITLQRITIARFSITKEIEHTKRKLSKGMLPQETAEVIVDSIRSNPNTTHQQIIENVPAKVGGYSGFKLVYGYQTKEGLKIKVAYYGTLIDDGFYYLRYEAPARHYFEKDYPVFEKMKDTFRILKTGRA